MENEFIYHKQYLSALIKESAKEDPETILVMFFMQEMVIQFSLLL